jgi:Xaa-Pro aminopeptidase
VKWSQREERLRSALVERKLDAFLVTHTPNVRYLTGFTGTSGLLLVLPDQLVFLSDFRYDEQAEKEVGPRAVIEIVPSDIWARVWEILGNHSAKTVGFESHVTSVEDMHRFDEKTPRWDFLPVRQLVEGLRLVKEPQEVAAIKKAAEIATTALDRVLKDRVSPGRREIDVAADLERELRILGSEWHPFETIVASGPQSALPHAGTSGREIQTGEFLLFDFGARVDGYCSDITRTVVVGTASQKQKDVYGVVRNAQKTACETVVPGLLGKEADHIARSLIEAAGYGDQFGHSLGHGLGLEVHEEPRLTKSNTKPLPAGSVVTIEPGIYLPGWGGVRIEDDVYLRDGGIEILSDYTTELIEIN